MNRIPEPEIMDDLELVEIYDEIDVSESLRVFIDGINIEPSSEHGRLAEIGCGNGKFTMEIAKKFQNLSITAFDGSAAMIEVAKRNIVSNGLTNRVDLRVSMLNDFEASSGHYDVIVSKHLLHHLEDPFDLWRKIASLATPETEIFIIDLIRPDSKFEAKMIVESSSPGAPKVFKMDYLNSLLAAFELEEVIAQVTQLGFEAEIQVLNGFHFLMKLRKKA